MSSGIEFTDEVVKLSETGREIRRYTVINRGYREVLTQKTRIEMVLIPGGECCLGAPREEEGWRSSQGPRHSVRVEEFYISRYPIVQSQWREVAKLPAIDLDLNPFPSHFEGGSRPVERVNWFEAVEFCARLSAKTGENYRLPTEKEWEYACRAGTTTPFHFGETLSTDFANYSGVDWEYNGKICNRGAYGRGELGDDRRETTPVEFFKVANDFGVHDLHGNVREWCADAWRPNHSPDTPADPDRRAIRGGSWNGGPDRCRSAYRAKFLATASLYDLGFRIARDP